MSGDAGSDAIVGAQRRAAYERALGRIASLVAVGVTPMELFDAVAREVSRFLAVPGVSLARYGSDATLTVLAAAGTPDFPAGSRWPLHGLSLAETILATGRPARIDDYAALPDDLAAVARKSALRSAVAVPVTLDGVIWGLISASTPDPAPLPADTEERLAEFTELVAVAIAHAATQDRLQRLTDERAAVRRLARLVTDGAPAAELFAAVVREVVGLLDVPGGALLRYEPDRSATVLASVDFPGLPLGSRFPLDGPSLAATILDTGQPARIDDYSDLGGTIAASIRDSGFRSAFAVPITVDGAVWGLIGVGTPRSDPLPADADARLSDLTELLASAISNAAARDRLRGLADGQAALRRLATLVAEGAPTADVIAAAVGEIGLVLAAPAVALFRYEPDRTATVMASRDVTTGEPFAPFSPGDRFPLDGTSISATVLDTGRPARIDDYSALPGVLAARVRGSGLRSTVGVPILVDGAVWGAINVGTTLESEPLPADLEDRLHDFAELVAVAISKGQAHADLRRLADEQAALRRVATRVAAGATPGEIFAAVVDEIASILGLQGIEMARYEGDGTATVIGASGNHPFPQGSRWRLDVPSVMASVFRTGRPARLDYSVLPGTIAEAARDAGFRSAIGAPIIVDGATWGAIIAFSTNPERIAERSELRLSQFTELVATAVSNATARAELVASRARIVTAGDEARQRLERNLHDGTQQRLLALGLDLQGLGATLAAEETRAHVALEKARTDLAEVLDEVREVGRGLHPAQLSRGGLGMALRALARRSPIPVEITVDVGERPPAPIEIAVYYVVSEAVTNAMKHSRATAISVRVERRDAALHATIVDDGVGGAVVGNGSGLIGLTDRVEALGGRFALDSPPGRGTTIAIELP